MSGDKVAATLITPKRQSIGEIHHPTKIAPSTLLNSEEDNYDFDYQELLQYEYDVTEFDPFEFMAKIGTRVETRPPVLPKKTAEMKNRNTLVLDLDETLVHSSTETLSKADYVFPVVYQGVTYSVNLRKRPYLMEFLETVSSLFEIAIFTASEGVYADKLLNIIDPERKLIHHRVFRDSCTLVDGYYLKDLQILGRDLKRTIIVDNSPEAYSFNVNNGIPIVSWFDDENDQELLRLLPLLKKLAKTDNVQKDIKKKFGLQKILANYTQKSKVDTKQILKKRAL